MLKKVNSFNLSKLTDLIDGKNLTKADIVRSTGLSRPTLDGILEGKDLKVSTIIRIANAVGKPVSYFFDTDNTPGIVTHGDYSPGKIEGHGAMIVGDTVLAERIKSLEALIKEKDERIKEKDERIADLKDIIKNANK